MKDKFRLGNDKITINGINCLGWQQTFDAALDIIALISADHEILKINRAGSESLGRLPEEIIGKKCYEIVHGLNAPIDGCSCVKAAETGKSEISEIVDNGRCYLTTASLIHDENSKLIAFAHTVKDITYLKENEEALKTANDLLEEKIENRTKELFEINEKLIQENYARKKTEKELKESKSILLKQKVELENKNIALGEIINQIELEKIKMRDDIITNIDKIVFPIIDKLSVENVNSDHLKLLRHHIERLSCQYGNKITTANHKLTLREIEVCNMIKSGLSSKEISSLLKISLKTVEKHRRNIRKKFKIDNKRVNLGLYISNL